MSLRDEGPVDERRPRFRLGAMVPLDAQPFASPASPFFIWATVGLAWLVSLLPWRLWVAVPDLLLLVIAFWCVYEPGRISMLVAFVLGLLMDVHDGALLGGQALTYTLVCYGALSLHRRLQRFNTIVQAVHLLPVFVFAKALSSIGNAWLAGEWVGWGWLWSALLTVLLWPLADILLRMPQRSLVDDDAGPG